MATFQFGGLVEQVNSVTAAGGTTTLTNTSKQIQYLTASGSNGQTFTLPDATTMVKGQKFEFYNTATGLLTVNKNGGSLLTTVNPSSSILIKLVDNSSSAGTWVTLANGSASTGGSKNYLSAVTTSQSSTANTGNGNFESGSTTGWSLAHSALTSNFPSTVGTAGNSFSSAGGAHGGSAASGNLSISTVSSGQLAGTYSLSYASSAATTAGDMLISDSFNIDTEDQAKVLGFSIAYKAQTNPSNGNFSGTSSNSFGVAIYDVTNAAWIMPAGVYNIVQSSGVGICKGTFQTSSNGTAYQIAFFNANASSGAITMYLDDFVVGPQIVTSGPAMTDFQSYTPVFTGFGTVTNIVGLWRRVGDSVEILITATAGTTTGTTAFISLPSGQVVDSSKISTSQHQIVGSFTGYNASQTQYTPALALGGDSVMKVGTQFANNNGDAAANGNAVQSNGANFSIHAKIPITGWSSNTAMSADTDTRVVAAYYTGNPPTGTLNSSNNPVTFGTKVSDTHNAYSGSTYTIPVSGYYNISAQIAINTTSPSINDSQAIDILKNGSVLLKGVQSVSNTSVTGYRPLIMANGVYLNAGDTIQIASQTDSSAIFGNFSGANFFSITRVSGPAIIQATETVAARFVASNGDTIGNSNTTYICFPTKVYDTHGAFSAGSNNSTTASNASKFTAPVSGYYNVHFGIHTDSVSTGTSITSNTSIFVNGTELTRRTQTYQQGAGAIIGFTVSDVVHMNAGDTMQWAVFQTSGGTRTQNGNSFLNTVTVNLIK